MDTKNRNSNHLKKRKSGRDNGKQEMFVLPPDVLKKLGISIGNINGNQVVPPDANVAQSTEISNENIGNLLAKNNNCIKESPDSSILETASLMKKSVFLSPTFVSTVTNVIPGEVEILSKNNVDSCVDEPDSAVALNNILVPIDNIEVTDLVPETSHIQNACHDINVNGEYTYVKDLDQVYPNMAPDEHKEAVADVNLNFHENIDNLDYSCENMVSLQCNTDIIFTQNTTEVNLISSTDNNADSDNNVLKLSEESIVTEETMPLSKLRDLKILHSLNVINPSEDSNEESKSTNKTIPSEAPDTIKLIIQNEIASDVNAYNNNNVGITDINNYVHTNLATSPQCSQTIEITNGMENDENYKELVNKDVYKHIEMNTSDKKTKISEVLHSEQACAESQFNENSPIIEKCNGIDEYNDHDDDNDCSDTNKVDTFVNTNPSNREEKPEINNIENHIPALNDYECNIETRQKSIGLIKETNNVNNNSTKCSLKKKPRRKSNSKERKHSKSTVENNCGVRNSSDKHNAKCDSSTFKNIEVSTVPDEGLANILSRTKELSTSNTDGKVDQVKEIAAYLKKFSHIYKDKDKLKKEFGKNYINKKQNTNSNTSAIMSKLCIQGVEKPGGKGADKKYNEESKVFKTYTRNQQSKLSTDILRTHETCNKVDVLDDELNTVNIPMPSEIQEFCSCYDFGRLAYYDDDSLYEHIHFLQHTSVDCKIEILFAIYNDEESELVVNNYESGLEQEQKVEDKGEANTHEVCWSIFQDKYTETEDNSDSEQICHNYEVNKFNNSCKNSLQETELNNVALKETIDHDMLSCEKLSRDNQDDETNSTAVASGTEDVNADISISEPKLMLTSTPVIGTPEMSNVNSKVVAEQSDDKELRKSVIRKRSINEKYTYSKRSQYLESKNNANKEPNEITTPKAIKNATPKRKITENQTPPSHTNNKDEPSNKKNIKCGLCNTLFSEVEWEDHISQQHHMIAWKSGSSINFDDQDLLDKLKDRLKTLGTLKCSICKMKTRKFKKFIAHVKECVKNIKDSNSNKKSDKPLRKSRIIDEKVTCGVCQKTMLYSSWIEHMGKQHFYLAWIQGQPALNLEDEAVVKHHLQNIVRLNGCLTCYKCGFTRSRVNLYQGHIQTCDGSGLCLVEDSSTSVDLNCTSNVEEQEQEVPQPEVVINVKCGVCKEDVDNLNWIEHIAKEHNYMAWQEGDTPLDLDDQEAVWNHLQQFIRQNGGLTCHKCGLNRKRVKLYLTHIETCDGTNSQADTSVNNVSTDQLFEVPIVSDDRKVVNCGVCSQEVPILEWVQHIGKEHNYLAWQEGSKPLVLDDEMEIRAYLLEVSKQIGGLICNKCEKKIKYSKTFLQHLKECTGERVSLDSSKLNKSVANNSSSNEYSFSTKKIKTESVTCGVCATVVETAVWMDHLQKVHQYMAWIEGQPPLDVENAEMLQKHLYDISKIMGGLVCMKCGVRRKYVKTYQQHVETCQGEVCGSELTISLMSRDILECAICNEKVVPKDWRNHAMTKHYNIAWIVGDAPIELNNPYAVESYIKEYLRKYNKLVCKVCGISRVSCVGFYAHIITCGKTEQETEMYKSVCEICHNKYLRIYKSQHMTMHREAEYALERKLLAAKEKELKKEEPVEVVVGSRRKAAERAWTVIEKYKSGCKDGASNHCDKCGFNSEIEKELADHVCVDDKWGDASDSDESVELDGCSDDESDETDVDSNVSDEELEAREQVSHKKKRWSDNNYQGVKIARLPYQVKSNSAYMKKSAEEFIEKYLTDEDLFTQWRSCKIEAVLENEVERYMPPIEESCKFRLDENQDWMSFNRFESQKIKDTIVLFAGASIQCMSWVPAGGAAQLVCVAAHAGADVPRRGWDRTAAAPALLQIWDCGNLISTMPKLVLGIAHDYGTVWAIDWCPSGARDLPDFVPEENKMHRLGLLAAACSNGSAYIFLVPYPSSITEEDKLFYKLKPVVELRLVSNGNRKAYQASAIKWSTQKGHSHVVVGYADGTTAYYDLNAESPILRTTENDMTVFYPYHDERVQNSCIEDVDVYPAGDGGGGGARAGGAVCVGSAGGAGAGALQSHLAAGRVLFPPHWPAALLAGDDCLVNLSINELEWWGGGRRLGGVQHAAGCAWCGRVAAAALPLLRLMRLHPCFADVHKQVIGTLQMVPLGSKRKRQTDELAMIVEPITYNESVKKYGIELKQITTRDRVTQQKLTSMPRDAYPERFPLSDVAALQFCPSFKHHHKLALATHAGLVFIMNV